MRNFLQISEFHWCIALGSCCRVLSKELRKNKYFLTPLLGILQSLVVSRINLRSLICPRRLFIIESSQQGLKWGKGVLDQFFGSITEGKYLQQYICIHLSLEYLLVAFLALKIPLSAFYGIQIVCLRLCGQQKD